MSLGLAWPFFLDALFLAGSLRAVFFAPGFASGCFDSDCFISAAAFCGTTSRRIAASHWLASKSLIGVSVRASRLKPMVASGWTVKLVAATALVFFIWSAT